MEFKKKLLLTAIITALALEPISYFFKKMTEDESPKYVKYLKYLIQEHGNFHRNGNEVYMDLSFINKDTNEKYNIKLNKPNPDEESSLEIYVRELHDTKLYLEGRKMIDYDADGSIDYFAETIEDNPVYAEKRGEKTFPKIMTITREDRLKEKQKEYSGWLKKIAPMFSEVIFINNIKTQILKDR